MIRSLFVVIITVCAFATTSARADDVDTANAAARLGVAANCKDKASPWRTWCPAATWAKGKAGTLRPGIMVGVTVALPADADVKQALSDRVSFVVLAVRKDGAKLLVTLRDITPENAAETEMVAKAVMGVSAVLKGKAKDVVLVPDLRGFADSLVPAADRLATKTKSGWTWENDANRAELRQVGNAWVVIETPKAGGAGRFLTVLTSKVR